MKKTIFILCCLVVNILLAQTEKGSEFINLDPLRENELYSLQNNGWAVVKTNEDQFYLANFSNKEYVLHLSLTCKDPSRKPKYLIEYNNNYGDKAWGGLDFASSQVDNGKKVQFEIDQKNIENPFQKNTTAAFENFKAALKKSKNLSLKFYNEEFNPETGKDEPRLNREIIFKLENSHLLDVPTECGEVEEDTTEVPTTTVVEAAE